MAAAIVPRLFPSVCQLQTLAPTSNAVLSQNLQYPKCRIRASPINHVAAPRWSLRVSAEPAAQSIAEENDVETEDAAAEVDEDQAQPGETNQEQSEADQLIMSIKADGSIADVSIPTMKTALESLESVSDVTISSSEGLTTIKLTKRTVIQATNVASELVDVMEKAGFRMHTLNLAIDDDE